METNRSQAAAARLQTLREYASKGKNAKETATAMKISLSYAYVLAKQNGIQLRKTGQRRSDIDALLTGEYSITEIAQKVGPVAQNGRGRLTKQAVEQYIKRTGQKAEWKASRKKFTKCAYNSARKEFLPFLAAHAIKEAEDDWALHKAVSYHLATRSSIPLRNLLKLFRAYESAAKAGRRISYEKFAKMSGVGNFGTAARVLGHFKLPSLYGTHSRVTPEKEKNVFCAYFFSDMPSTDVAYFLDMLPSNVNQRWNRSYGIDKRRKLPSFGFGRTGGRPTYRMASEAYHLQDLGFNRDDIAEYFGGRQKSVDYLLDRRTQIQSKIINLLDVLFYPNVHTKPYLEK